MALMGGGRQEKILRLHLGSLLKQLVCATRYAINVGTKPTKSVTLNEFSFEVKSLSHKTADLHKNRP